jgi:hypothetical protein
MLFHTLVIVKWAIKELLLDNRMQEGVHYMVNNA